MTNPLVVKLICVKSGLCSCCVYGNTITDTGEVNISINKFYYGELQANLYFICEDDTGREHWYSIDHFMEVSEFRDGVIDNLLK